MSDLISNPRSFTSASRANRDAECPGAFLLEQSLPEPPRNEAQTLGDKVHKALANSSDTAALTALSARERDLFDSCRAIEKKLILDWFGEDFPKPMRVFRHERYWMKFFNPNRTKYYQHSGEADVVFLAAAKALILDYKTLAGEVADASMNLQLRDLACLLRGNLMYHPKDPQPLVECATAIVQPLVTHSPILCRYTEPDLDRAAQEMMARVIMSNDPDSKRKAGEHCKFCKAAYWGKCQEYQVYASATLPTFRGLASVPVEQWQPEQRTIFMDRYAIAEQWLKDTKAALEAGAVSNPAFVPGYGMRDGRVNQPITDLQTLLERFVAHGGTATALLEACSVSKEKLETVFKKLIKSKIKGSIAQNKAYEDFIAGITTPKPNKPTLKKI